MIRFGAIAKLGFFGFDEVADVNVGAQSGSGTQMGERADDRAAARLGNSS